MEHGKSSTSILFLYYVFEDKYRIREIKKMYCLTRDDILITSFTAIVVVVASLSHWIYTLTFSVFDWIYLLSFEYLFYHEMETLTYMYNLSQHDISCFFKHCFVNFSISYFSVKFLKENVLSSLFTLKNPSKYSFWSWKDLFIFFELLKPTLTYI